MVVIHSYICPKQKEEKDDKRVCENKGSACVGEEREKEGCGGWVLRGGAKCHNLSQHLLWAGRR